MTDDLGTALRASVDRSVTVEVDSALLLQGVQRAKARLDRRDRRRALGAVTAAAVAASAVGLLVPTFRPDAAPRPVATLPPVPSGSQAVSWHGVQVFVPEQWQLGARDCSEASESTVLVPGFVRACLRPYVPGLTVVDFADVPVDGSAGRTSEWVAAATTDVDLDGTPARSGSLALTDEAGVRRVLVVPSEGVVLSVRSPDAAAADRILATAAVVAVDANGCPSRIPASRPAGKVARPSAADSLLPDQPLGLSACRYTGLRLVASRRVDDQVKALQRRVDALATGVSGRKPEREISDEACRSSDDDVTTFEARYADGEPLRVFFRGQACTDRSASNGSTTRRSDQALLGDLFKVIEGEPLTPADDRTPASPQPAPELGYARELKGPIADGDLLARVDSDAAPRLLGIVRNDGVRCIVTADLLAGAREQSCTNDEAHWISSPGTIAVGLPGTAVVVGATDPQARTIKVLLDGRHLATWPTYGGGAAYEQRRFFLGQIPTGGTRLELVAMNSLGDSVSGTSLDASTPFPAGSSRSIDPEGLTSRAPKFDAPYLDCARLRGFDPEFVEVLIDGAGIPRNIKSSVEVPARVHGPCMAEIGGVDLGQSSRGN